MEKKKIIRVATVDMSLGLLKGQLRFLNTYYNVIAVSSNGPSIKQTEKEEGVKVVTVNMQRKIALLSDIRSLIKLYILFKREKPYIVHSITPKAGLLSMTASFFAKVPNRMHTFTGLIFPSKTGLFQKLLINMDRILCFFATNIYPEGHGVKKDLENYKITSKPLKVLANGNINGIETDHFDPSLYSSEFRLSLKNSLNILPKDFVYIFVGRLVGDKGVNELVEAFVKFSNENKNTKLLLVGPFEKELDPLLKTTIKHIETNKNIIHVGWQNDVRPYFSISSVLVFPSYREGFPNVVMQAGAMELSSIVTDISGCNEIIKHNEHGVIVPVKNTTAVYNAMKQIYGNQDNAKTMGVKSRINIVSKFERSQVWEAILTEYKQLK